MNAAKHERTLGIAPASRGFGFALIQDDGTLVDWGFRRVSGDKNKGCLKALEGMIDHCAPGVIVLQDYATKTSRRPTRIRVLGEEIIALAARQKVNAVQLTREEINEAFFPDGTGTKYLVAESLAKRFPSELVRQLPPKRKPWMSEDYRMGIFDAVALCLAPRIGQRITDNFRRAA